MSDDRETEPMRIEGGPMEGDYLLHKADLARPDEMAAGLIHESGTGGIDRDHCGYVDASKHEASRRIGGGCVAPLLKPGEEGAGGISDVPLPLYAISGNVLDEIVSVIGQAEELEGGHLIGQEALGYIRAARENGVMKEREDERLRLVMAQAERHAADIKHQLAIATQQRDTLSRQVDSLVQRLAASHVAQGLIDMAAAQGFVQKEILPINQVLAQIAAQPQPEQST